MHFSAVTPGRLLSRRSFDALRLSQGHRMFDEHVKRVRTLEGRSLQACQRAYFLWNSLQEIRDELLGLENRRAHARLFAEPPRERALILAFLLLEAAYVRDRPLQVGVLGVRTQDALHGLGPGRETAWVILSVLEVYPERLQRVVEEEVLPDQKRRALGDAVVFN